MINQDWGDLGEDPFVKPAGLSSSGVLGNAGDANEQKDLADVAFKGGDFERSILHYTLALQHLPRSEKLLGNRSAAYLKLGKARLALDDAEDAEEAAPSWSKCYFRKGQALREMGRLVEAIANFEYGRSLDGENGWLAEIKRAKEMQAAVQAKRQTWV